MLDELLSTLDPPLSPEREATARRFADTLRAEGWMLVGSERLGPVLRLSFADDRRRAVLSVEEMAAWLHAHDRGLPAPLPLVEEGD